MNQSPSRLSKRKRKRSKSNTHPHPHTQSYELINLPHLTPLIGVSCPTAGLNEEKKLSGEAPSPGFTPWFLYVLPKISPTCQQQNHTQARDAGCGVPGRDNTPFPPTLMESKLVEP